MTVPPLPCVFLYLPELELLPTPVSAENEIEASNKRPGSTLITPQSSVSLSSVATGKRRRTANALEVQVAPKLAPSAPIRRNPVRSTKTYLEGLGRKIMLTALKSSWLQRKDRFIHQPSPDLDEMYMTLYKHFNPTPEFSKKLAEMSEASLAHTVNMQDIRKAQKNRKIDRRELIELILPIVNSYGMHHETLFIAVNMMDRFLSKSFVFVHFNYKIVAAACAFLAIKYNEEFDPTYDTVSKAMGFDALSFKDALLTMERKIVQVLEWDLRPITPHVIAYTIFDQLHGFFPLGFKRYLVNIIERVVLSAYCSKQWESLDQWDLLKICIAAIDYAYKCTKPEISTCGAANNLASEFEYQSLREDFLDDSVCEDASYLPIVYGDPISLPDPLFFRESSM